MNEKAYGKLDPATVDGSRRIAMLWTYYIGVGLLVIALCWGGWAVAQAGGYQDNVRGWNAGDPFPWVPVLLGGAFSVFAFFRAIGKWARHGKLRRGSR